MAKTIQEVVTTKVVVNTTTNVTAAEDGFGHASKIVEEQAGNLKDSIKAIKEDLQRLQIPKEYWEDAKEVKTDLRRLTVKIESFVRRVKANLEFAVEASKNKKFFEWQAGVERSLELISREVDALLIVVNDCKTRIKELKKKVLKDADDYLLWSTVCFAISVVGVVAAVATGLAMTVVASPYTIPLMVDLAVTSVATMHGATLVS